VIDALRTWAAEHRDALHAFLRRCFAEGRPLMLQTDLGSAFSGLRDTLGGLAGSPLEDAVRLLQEAVLQPPWAYFALRERAGHWHYLRAHLEEAVPEAVSVSEFLRFKESLVRPDLGTAPVLEIDFGPFNRQFPRLAEIRSIGQGVLFLNRQLSSAMFQKPAEGHAKLLNFLRLHAMEGQQLMLHAHLGDVGALQRCARRRHCSKRRRPPPLGRSLPNRSAGSASRPDGATPPGASPTPWAC
jgi:sucrose synthase